MLPVLYIAKLVTLVGFGGSQHIVMKEESSSRLTLYCDRSSDEEALNMLGCLVRFPPAAGYIIFLLTQHCSQHV